MHAINKRLIMTSSRGKGIGEIVVDIREREISYAFLRTIRKLCPRCMGEIGTIIKYSHKNLTGARLLMNVRTRLIIYNYTLLNGCTNVIDEI